MWRFIIRKKNVTLVELFQKRKPIFLAKDLYILYNILLLYRTCNKLRCHKLPELIAVLVGFVCVCELFLSTPI